MDGDKLVGLTFVFGVLTLVVIVAMIIAPLIGIDKASWFVVGAIAMLFIELVIVVIIEKVRDGE